jgi:NAD(P)-dependent dehydrogenase (short-subunit alcohol dehydrogenase family)
MSAPDLAHLRILVTGATDGIGRLTVDVLAARGASVLVHGRSAEKVARTVEAVSALGGEALGFVADLASLDETRRLAREVIERCPELDVLVNNAGVGFGADRTVREVSRDGHELRFAVNYLAPFVLTEALLARDLPRRAVIDVASIGQEALDFADLECERYDGVRAYRRSKLALVMMSFDLAERRPDRIVHALHPGTLLATRMVVEAGIAPRGPVSRGAESILAVLGDALAGKPSGLYYDETRPAEANPEAYDRAARARLRAATLALVR